MRRQHATLFAGLAGVAVILGTAFAVVVAQDLLEDRDPDVFTQPTVVFDESAMGSAAILTDEQRQQAIDTALGDERVKNLLADHPHHVVDVAIWTGAEGRFMGALVTLSFEDAPVTVAGDWVVLSWDCSSDSPPPPVQAPFTARYADVALLHILTDLTNAEIGSVEQLLPGGDGPGESATLLGVRTYTGAVTGPTSCSRD